MTTVLTTIEPPEVLSENSADVHDMILAIDNHITGSSAVNDAVCNG